MLRPFRQALQIISELFSHHHDCVIKIILGIFKAWQKFKYSFRLDDI